MTAPASAPSPGSFGAVATDLRSDGLTFEYVYTIESSEHLKPNLHVLHHGSQITSSRFRSALARAGGQGDTQKIRHLKILSRYVLKLALAGIDVPEIDATAAMDLHLRINGEKLLHSSRRFWRDERGDALSGIGAARRAAGLTPKGSAPTQELLASWRSGWKLPPIASANGRSVGAVRPPCVLPEGAGTEAKSRRHLEA